MISTCFFITFLDYTNPNTFKHFVAVVIDDFHRNLSSVGPVKWQILVKYSSASPFKVFLQQIDIYSFIFAVLHNFSSNFVITH